MHTKREPHVEHMRDKAVPETAHMWSHKVIGARVNEEHATRARWIIPFIRLETQDKWQYRDFE